MQPLGTRFLIRKEINSEVYVLAMMRRLSEVTFVKYLAHQLAQNKCSMFVTITIVLM